MAFRLPRLPRGAAFVDPKTGFPSAAGQLWWQQVVEAIEAQEARQDELLEQILAAQEAAETAQTAAAAAQAAADAAQQAIDDLPSAPPSGVRTVTADDAFGDSDSILYADATAGPIVITLPSVTAQVRSATVVKTDASANIVTVSTGGSLLINGIDTSVDLLAQNDSVSLSGAVDPVSGQGGWYG